MKVVRVTTMNGYIILCVGILLLALGSYLIAYGPIRIARRDAEQTKQEALAEAENARKERARDTVAMNEKFQSIMVALGAARREQSKSLTDDKIGLIEDDLAKWAEGFARTRQEKQRLFDSTSSAVTQKEIQTSAQCRPLFEFTVRFIEESLRAYANRTGYEIKIGLPSLPKNFYDRDPDTERRKIVFKDEKSIWHLYAQGVRPISKNPMPRLTINFNSHDLSGGLYIVPDFANGKFTISSADSLPTLDSINIKGELSDYEGVIKPLMQKLIEAQLLQTP